MEKNASILVVDDDKEIADLVEIYLVNDGYQVLKASDGEQCLETLKQHPEVRMLILDIMMPGIDGLEVCREIRKTSNIPILILSAKAEDMDKIVGFGTGADDYLTKPFHPLELLARVKSQMKRYTTIQLGEEQEAAGKDEILKQNVTADKSGLYRSLAAQCGVARVGKAINEVMDTALDILKDRIIVDGKQISIR